VESVRAANALKQADWPRLFKKRQGRKKPLLWAAYPGERLPRLWEQSISQAAQRQFPDPPGYLSLRQQSHNRQGFNGA